MVPVASRNSTPTSPFTDTIGVARSPGARLRSQGPCPEIGSHSPHHMGPPGLGIGTITVRAKTFQDMMYDICRSSFITV
jgi:hypothetical protein